MKKKDYVTTKTDNNDLRRQLLELSDKSKKQLPSFHKQWDACRKTIEELLEQSPHFDEDLRKIEMKISKKNYKERTLNNLK